MRRGPRWGGLTCALLAALPPAVSGQEAAPSPAPPPREFRIGGEIKINFRDTKDVSSPVFTPFPRGFVPPGTRVAMRTVDAGRSLELQNVALIGEGDIVSGVSAKVRVHFLDLYNRNPTSSDDRILVREAWVCWGGRPGSLEPLGVGSRAYVQVGLAPRFTKQILRRFESYGLWGTAVARFEQPQVEVGARLGRYAYVRAMAGNGNPLFIRDTNALAGDNGTPERRPGNVDPICESGFPILYDAKPQDLNLSGQPEVGLGLGGRIDDGNGKALDVVAWHFRRNLADRARIRGTFYEGDLEVLRGAGFPLPFSGRRKREWGVNVEAKARGLRFFGQYVDQDMASLERRGFEVEAAWILELPGLFLVKESPFGNWIQPALRVSYIDNFFEAPREYPARSVDWDWRKYDLGVRIGLVRGVDLTLEYARHDAITSRRTLHDDEALATLRVGF